MPFQSLPIPVGGTVITAAWGTQAKINFDESPNARVTTAEDLAVATGPGAFKRFPKGADGQRLGIVGGVLTWVTNLDPGSVNGSHIADGSVGTAELAAGAVTSDKAAFSSSLTVAPAPVTMSTSAWQTVVTVTPGAGTWLIYGQVCFSGPGGTQRGVAARLLVAGSVVREANEGTGLGTAAIVPVCHVATLAAAQAVALAATATGTDVTAVAQSFQTGAAAAPAAASYLTLVRIG